MGVAIAAVRWEKMSAQPVSYTHLDVYKRQVDDIVSGTILAAEKIDDGTAVNLGTMERIRVIDAAKMVLEFSGQKADIRFRPDMPTGPVNRVADNALAKRPVSYTHLDVYKRQILSRVAGRNCG